MIAFFLSVLVLAIATLAFLSLYIWPNEYQHGDSKTTLDAPEEGGASAAVQNKDETGSFAGKAPELRYSLPDDIPHRGWLEAGGVGNLNDLLGREDLTEIPYIGPERAADVQAYLAEEVDTVSE